MDLHYLVSFILICFVLLLLYFIRLENKWHYLSVSQLQLWNYFIILLFLTGTILISVLPMSLSPYWNGSVRILGINMQQYDIMGDSLLQGKFYIDNDDVISELSLLNNPYDPKERKEAGIVLDNHFDEAYYKSHFYMCFGIVPTLILFMPFKLLTGNALLTYQATQIFVAVMIIGFFYIFYILCQRYFQSFPFSCYVLLSVAFSILSISYCITYPALYCTAQISAACMMLWSIIFFFKSVWLNQNDRINMSWLFLGGLTGALAFGCRPTVAIANIIIIAVILQILKVKQIPFNEKIKCLLYLLFPYIVVGTALMYYNYLRFDNPFEFGYTYQITLIDFHKSRNVFTNVANLEFTMKKLANFFLGTITGTDLPNYYFNGVFYGVFPAFPILLFSARILSHQMRCFLSENNLLLICLLIFFTPIFIVLCQLTWIPYLLPRYQLDFLYLLSILSFIAIAIWYCQLSNTSKKYLLYALGVLSFLVFIMVLRIFCVPFDGNYTMFYPEAIEEIQKGLHFGFY